MNPIPSATCWPLRRTISIITSGISDILTLEETVKRNPQAVVQLCLGAFNAGMREFTANVAGNDLVA
jgi:hypothetical protein